MERHPTPVSPPFDSRAFKPSRILSAAFLVAAAALPAFLIATGHAAAAALVAGLAFLLALRLWVETSNIGRLGLLAELLLVGWFALAPLADYYIRFPPERAVLTFDRVMIGCAFGLLAYALFALSSGRGKVSTTAAIPHFEVSWFELAWLFLTILSLVSVVFKSNDLLGGLKISVDGFGLPLVAFYLARRHFNTERHSRALLASAMMIAFFLVATGGAEFITGRDFFPYPSSQLIREGELRVNGPFTSDTSFEVVSLIFAVFLRGAPRVFAIRFDRSAKIIYWAALGAAVIAAMLPLSRGVGIGLVLSWVVLEVLMARHPGSKDAAESPGVGDPLSGTNRPRSGSARTIRIALVTAGAVILLLGGAALLNPNSYEQRLLSSRNVLSRLATWRVGLKVASTSPVAGVGLGNYIDAFEEVYSKSDREMAAEMDTKVAVGPHSNPIWILSELGPVGLCLYLAAFAMLFLMAWRASRSTSPQRARRAAACLIALLVAYWIPGLSLASGYYADINLYFFFIAGALCSRFGDRDMS